MKATFYSLAAAGTTGNNTHASVLCSHDIDQGQIAFQFVVEVAGGTPTVTWKIQGSLDRGRQVSDSAANWYDLAYITDASSTLATTTLTSTAVGAKVIYLADAATARHYQYFRAVTTANTNITYRCEAYAFCRL